ncbi:MAG: CmcI family methyltransferase [Candidatus Obscuribacterales bacterium]|nr:CmcI family methyltransferase [Candidatus Obscuribacterales bacterium]
MIDQFKHDADKSPETEKVTEQRLKSLLIDCDSGTVKVTTDADSVVHQLSSPEGFAAVGQAWLRAGWDAKYVYSFSWMGRPIIQLPDDAFRMQELIYSIKPDVIVETGVAHGGSLIFYASLCKAMGKGKIVGIDIEIRAHNRRAIEEHEMSSLITLIEGDSVDSRILSDVRRTISDAKTVMVILDSCHTKKHVANELLAYSQFVTPGSYIIAMDGIMEQVTGAPRTSPDWTWNNPKEAAIEFAKKHLNFQIETDKYIFNEGTTKQWITYSPCGVLKRID